MGSPLEHEFLFVHSAGPPGSRSRDDRMKRRMRRHVMRDIGKARRKLPRNPQVEFILPQSTPALATSESGGLQACPSWLQLEQSHRTILVSPFWDQHPFAVMHDNWGMNPFAAYAFALVLSQQRHPPSKFLPLVALNRVFISVQRETSGFRLLSRAPRSFEGSSHAPTYERQCMGNQSRRASPLH